MTKTTTTTKQDRLEIRRTFDASLEDAWAAWTDPDQVAKWFAPGPMNAQVHRYEVREGGEFEVDMVDPDGNVHKAVGTFRTIQPKKKIVMTWRWKAEGTWGAETLVSVTFDAADGGTEIALVHEKLPDTESVENHTQGWTGCFEKLADAL